MSQSQYSGQVNISKENENGFGSQMPTTTDKNEEKINWDREVDFVFDEIRKGQVGKNEDLDQKFSVDIE